MLVASPRAVQSSGSWGCDGSEPPSAPARTLPDARSLLNEDKQKTPTNGLKTHGFFISGNRYI